MDKICNHVKVHADFVYATNPPISPWICAVCEIKGEDGGSLPAGPSYQELVEKFRDKAKE